MKNYLAYMYRHKLTQAWLKEHRIELRLHSSLRKSLNLHWYNIIHIYPGRKSQATSTQTHRAEPRRTRYDLLANEYCERASQPERAPQNPTKATQNLRPGYSEYGKLYASTKILF